ncbi:hypothetical protein AJ80_01861 [Polytolypa hystricis UAMH7299]|uniref:ubiquitinyl hydrolase 1 n=1 Tax=Polytolypa hystricis (strain UAMH7299) TaxID=1447883 RepID=A0A2B7Z140_POLH7|nr:hypothetical protein AJ80_01861 [Polytolypa hystricis UAMH7299]
MDDDIRESDLHLAERASIRESAYCIHGFGAESHTLAGDTLYKARDRYDPGRAGEYRSYSMASLVGKWTVGLTCSSNLLHHVETWRAPIDGLNGKSDATCLSGYSIEWTEPPSQLFPRIFCYIRELLSQAKKKKDKYRIMFLSTLVFSKKVNPEFVHTLLAFATVPGLRSLRQPSHYSFLLSDGYEPTYDKLVKLIKQQAHEFVGTISLHDEEDEEDEDEEKCFEEAVAEQTRQLVQYYLGQWPKYGVAAPPDQDSYKHINVQAVTDTVQPLFKSWYKNLEFRQFIEKAQEIIDTLGTSAKKPSKYSFSPPQDDYQRGCEFVTFEDLFRNGRLPISTVKTESCAALIGQSDEQNLEHPKLRLLLQQLVSTPGEYEKGQRKYLTTSQRLPASMKRYKARRIAIRNKFAPRLSPATILRHLSAPKFGELPVSWKWALVRYGLAICALQRALRIQECIDTGAELLHELMNNGHEGWDPIDHPDWLLLEIENNILIRPVQARITLEMISPSSGKNSVMQLNMGEESPQALYQWLPRPWQTKENPKLDQVQRNQGLYNECMATGGILLVQPEHLLSLELMGLDNLLAEEAHLGHAIISTQRWLDNNSRDILDESDEILSANFELVYTMGTQRALEFNPDRWIIIQDILGYVNRFASEVVEQFPRGLELRPVCSGSDQLRIRVLNSTAGRRLLDMVANEVCERGLPSLPVWNLPKVARDNLRAFLTGTTLTNADLESLKALVFATDHMRNSLLLLKGFPAPRAEFSHPGAAIVLTCLTYYYEGLADEQLYTLFENLALSDHAEEEYQIWIRSAPSLPAKFRHLSSVNIKDQDQCPRELFPPFRFVKGVIDFYLSHIVFPTEMREFPHKLSSSGWNIAREKAHPTTGFSGTNDSRYILLLSIQQRDLDEQRGTNAQQLLSVLGAKNTFHRVASTVKNDLLDAECLLQIVVNADPPIQVILDVGAQVLEMRNEQIAERWLSIVETTVAQVVVYFNEDNELSIVTRDRYKEPLMVSPFSQHMDKCLVYLDDAHTRGTDLALPLNYRAAVTLGPNLTKDRLVQACMRMRKLGKGQSLMFCAPRDVERKMLDCSGKNHNEVIEDSDILKWSISETWKHTRKSAPLRATQGLRYQKHAIAWSDALKAGSNKFPVSIAKSMLEDEAKTIVMRYDSGNMMLEEQVLLRDIEDSSLAPRSEQVEDIKAKCKHFAISSFSNAAFLEEQERELSPETERERQIEYAPALQPAIHSLDCDVEQFLVHGNFKRRSKAFLPAFATLKKTLADSNFKAAAWPKDLLVTKDFTKTVEAPESQLLDAYLRPVKWIASTRHHGELIMVVLSPFEANYARDETGAQLHVYAPRISV